MSAEIEIVRTDSENKDFQSLVALLDKELKLYDGDLNDFYHQYNSIEKLNNVVLCITDNKPIACGAFKAFDNNSVEIKRMYTCEEFRGRSFSKTILTELEKWAKELGYQKCILETGKKQVAAIQLYQTSGYTQIENYGPYKGVENSLCFEKVLQ